MVRTAMTPLLSLLLVAGAGATFAGATRARRRGERRALDAYASAWGKPLERERDMQRIGLYARLAKAEGPGTVDERTWRDLDLDAVFAHVDRTTSPVGQQMLFARLSAPPHDAAERDAFEAQVQQFGDDRSQRERAHLALRPLADVSASTLPILFCGEPPSVPWSWAPPALTAATVASLALTFVHPAFGGALLLCFLLNLALRFLVWKRVNLFVETARELDALLGAGRRLAAAGLEHSVERLGPMPRAVAWLARDKAMGDELSGVILEYLNVFFALDINAFVLTIDFLRKRRTEVRALYERIGRIDVALSVASLRAGASFTRPRFVETGPLAVDALVHPLVHDAVANSVLLEQRGLFITGSNMSGKSTFLKAVGVDVILAQALGTTFAARYEGPLLTVRTLIVGGDSITEGKSYYLAEVLAALERLEAIGDGDKHLVLVDEPFRGTNTEERIGAGKAYLEALVRRGAFAIAASHDRELGALLANDFVSKHFTERVDERNVVFDYTLRDGPCPTRNAIRILELAGFAPEIVEEARRVALAGRRGWT